MASILFGSFLYVSALAFGFSLAVLFLKKLNVLIAKSSRNIMENLELVPTDDLINEVSKRYDCMIFMGMKNEQGKIMQYKRRWNGGLYLCVALASNMAHFFNCAVLANEEPNDGKGT